MSEHGVGVQPEADPPTVSAHQDGTSRWAIVDDQVLVLDHASTHVYRVDADSAPDALEQLNSPHTRRRFMQSLAAGAVAGAAVVTLPTAAAAASDEGAPTEPAGAEPDAEPSSVPEEQDGDLTISGTSAGDGTVTVDWTDTRT